MLYAIVAVLVIIADQAVKYWVAGNIVDNTVKTLIPGVISLVNLHNDGAAFGFLSGGGARIYFIILTGVFTVAIIIALATNFISGSFGRWCIVLVTAGGLSNCIDRVIYGYVQDMFKIDLFNFAIFNVADIFITVFCILFVLYILFGGENDDEYNEDDDEDDEEEDDDDDEEYERKSLFSGVKSKFANPAKNSRKSRQSKYEDEYEQYKASHAARQQGSYSAPTYAPPSRNSTSPSSYAASDPFAEWERANARVESQNNTPYAAQAMGAPFSRPSYNEPTPSSNPQKAEPAQPTYKAPQPAYKPQSASSYSLQQPEAPKPSYPTEAPVVPSTEAPQKKSSSDFSLDDILAEFK